MWGAATAKYKQSLRAAILSKRDALSQIIAIDLGKLIQSRAIELGDYRACAVVGLYRSVGNEVGTAQIFEHALTAGKKIFYPAPSRNSTPEFVQVRSPEEFGPGRLGIPEPTGADRLPEKDRAQTVIFVPGVAFDAQGHRLGRGRGWYDRAQARLGKTAIFAALAYQFQVVDGVPTDSWDRNVDYVITENRVYDCAAHSSQCDEVF